MDKIYLDNGATTKMDKRVLDEMMPYFFEEYGNASSVYSLGRNARKAVEEAREKVAKAINADPEEIYFTSGGTESDITAIRGIAYSYRSKGNHIITSKIEHPAVLETCRALEKEGFEVTYIDVDEIGIVDLEKLENSITDKTILITIMYANNEIGVIQPIKEIAEIASSKGIYFHTDSVQAIGNVKIDVKKYKIDSLSMSAHKFYGPKGIGALYIKKGIEFSRLFTGGHQERNKRASTENVPAIVGMGKAIELAYQEFEEHVPKIIELRNYFVREIQKRIPEVKINGDMGERLPGNVNVSFYNTTSEGLLLNLDLAGICASSGSACTSGSLEPSYVLLAIQLPYELAKGSIRISIGKYNTKEEIDYCLEKLEEIVLRLRQLAPKGCASKSCSTCSGCVK